MRSRLVPGREPGTIEERFGPLAASLAVATDPDGLTVEVTAARFLGLPLPRMLAPVSRAREGVDREGRFTFDVPIRIRLLGRLSHYRGWLVEPQGYRDLSRHEANPSCRTGGGGARNYPTGS